MEMGSNRTLFRLPSRCARDHPIHQCLTLNTQSGWTVSAVTMVSKSPGIAILRRQNGPRRSKLRIRPRVFLFFVASVLLTSVLGAIVNDKVEEAWHQKIRFQGVLTGK
jgi:hypothetical protein